MSKPVEVRDVAVLEAAEAFDWYVQQSKVAADGFALALQDRLKAIGERGGSFAQYLSGTRRCLLGRYPYMIVFRVHSDRVEVIAVAHTSRRPGYWRRRV